jgi:excinuclease ABC subunit B
VGQVIYTSATPAEYELGKSSARIVELIVRPTGLVDPQVETKPVKGQVDDLYQQIIERAKRKERTLITTLTKRFAEDLTEHYSELGLKVKYLHSDIETLERSQIIRELRLGEFDALIGINLLREGLDIPEVSLVAILDADKEGFLRSTTSLIQTSGRAARNISGRVIFYADTITKSMQKAFDEMDRRRDIQTEYNKTHQIIPKSIKKSVQESLINYEKLATVPLESEEEPLLRKDFPRLIEKLEKEMYSAARNLEFEKAAELRDRIKKIREKDLMITA